MMRSALRWIAFPLVCALLYGTFLLKADVLSALTAPGTPAGAKYLPRPAPLLSATDETGRARSDAEDTFAYHGSAIPPSFSPVAMTVSPQGEVVVTGSVCGSTGCAYGTAKYDRAGLVLWFAAYAGPTPGESVPAQVAIDSKGNAYVTGYSENAAGGQDLATVKYDRRGRQSWAARQASTSGTSAGLALAIAGDDTVYVAGSPVGDDESGAGGLGFTLVHYDAAGRLLASTRYAWSGSGEDAVSDVKVDHSGNVYVTGRTLGSDKETHFATVKYDRNGALCWAVLDGGAGHAGEVPLGLGLDAADNAYVVGSTVEEGRAGYAIVKYDPRGQVVWSTRERAEGDGDFLPMAFVVDQPGNVYVTGFARDTAGTPGRSLVTVKHDAKGRRQWSARESSAGGLWPLALSANGTGEVQVLAAGAAEGREPEVEVTAYDAGGRRQWVAHQAVAGLEAEAAMAVLDERGGVFVVGRSQDPESRNSPTAGGVAAGPRLWTAKVVAAGEECGLHLEVPDTQNGVPRTTGER